MKQIIDVPAEYLDMTDAELSAIAGETEPHAVELAARSMQKGDRVNGLTLLDTKVGTKWAHLTWNDGTRSKHEIGVDDDFTVERTRGTQASHDARRVLSLRRRAAKRVEAIRAEGDEAVVAAVARLSEDIIGTNWGAERALDHGASVAYAVAEREVRRWVLACFDSTDREWSGDALKSHLRVAEELAERLWSRGFRATSRSTSVTHNLGEDIEREVHVKFIDSISMMW